MENVLELPEKYLTSFSPPISTTLHSLKTKVESHQLQSTCDHCALSSISDFLNQKILLLDRRREYLRQYRLAMTRVQHQHGLSAGECRKEHDEVIEAEYASANEAIEIKLGREIIEQDVQEGVESGDTIEDAYAAAMVSRIFMSTGKQKKHCGSSRGDFKKRVLTYYDAGLSTDDFEERWCHILGWRAAKYVVAAHLVPRSLDRDSVCYLFGADANPAADVRNALCLHTSLEQMLDAGDIAIVPVVGSQDQWKRLVTRKEILSHQIGDTRTQLEDIHETQLVFRSQYRPAKRYLFFRFLMTYLYHKSQGNVEWTKTVETASRSWASAGPYLREPTLRVLTRQFIGEDMPPSMRQICDKLSFPDNEGLPRSSTSTDRVDRALLNIEKCIRFPPTIDRGDSEREEAEENDSQERGE